MSITHEQFLQKYHGRKNDSDGNQDSQCVDLARLYVREVWGIEDSNFSGVGSVGGAIDAWTTFPHSLIAGRSDLVEKIPNNPDRYPVKGDILIWNTNMGGGYGHIAPVINATIMYVEVEEQNRTGNNDAAQTSRYDYNNVIGWLRYKHYNNTQTQQPMNENIKLIVQECINQGLNLTRDKEKVAYILATARHESDQFKTLEEYADGSAYEGRADLGNNQKGDGKKYKGRGYVQITGRNNYSKYRDIIKSKFNIDILDNPNSLLENKPACAFILVDGMINGKFTGKSLDSYPYTYTANDSEVKSDKAKVGEVGIDFWNCRRIINGTDQADRISGYANEYLDQQTQPQPQPLWPTQTYKQPQS
jgi:CHAP domain